MNKKSTIMLVEDDQLDVLNFKRAMRDLELVNPLLIAATGEEALALLGEHQHNLPIIIVMDLNMPRMNGIELLTALKNHPCWQRIPVIVLTTSDQSHERDACFQLSAASYIVKPLEYTMFVEMMRAAVLYWCHNLLDR